MPITLTLYEKMLRELRPSMVRPLPQHPQIDPRDKR